MQITSNFDRFDKHCAQTRLLQGAQLFSNAFFISEVFLAPEIDLQFRLHEAREQKYR